MIAIKIKIIIVIIAFICIIIISIFTAKKERIKNSLDSKSSELDNEIKDDSYWEKRFNGLKSDYEDREKYHNLRYEQLKAEYEDREGFLREMLEQSKRDYQLLKDEVISLQDIKTQLDEKLKSANKMIADYEIKLMKLESKFSNETK